jgi:hypothetical protein
MSDTTTTEAATVDQSTADGAASETGAESAAVTEGATALGDAGKKALDAMKADRNAARAEAKAAADELAALKAQAEGRQAEHEAIQKAREVESAALAKANERILKAEIKAASAGKLADPLDALKFLDLGQFEVGDDSDVDSDAIAAAIGALITDKPYLAAQGGGRFQGSADGGTRTGTAADRQLSREDISRMTPEQIVEAQEKGQFGDLLKSK